VETSFEIRQDLLDGLATLLHNKFEEYSGPFFYPHFSCRLAAVFADELYESYYYHEDIEKADNPMSVIAMYPWEADILLKAQEMINRGIPVAKPLGRLFVGEIEFALFEWVKGRTLLGSEDESIWKAYGQVLRCCHERGVALDDAAGRNAIWTGKEIGLIDLEHTYLDVDAKPLGVKIRKNSILRIKEELRKSGGTLDAFMRGYVHGK